MPSPGERTRAAWAAAFFVLAAVWPGGMGLAQQAAPPQDYQIRTAPPVDQGQAGSPSFGGAPGYGPGQPPAPPQAGPGSGQARRWLAGYRNCIDRSVATLAAQGGQARQVAETAYGSCRHMATLAGLPAQRQQALEQAAWSYAVQATLSRMQGDGTLGE